MLCKQIWIESQNTGILTTFDDRNSTLNCPRDFKTTVNPEDVNLCIDLYGKEKEVCSPEFKEIVDIIKPDV